MAQTIAVLDFGSQLTQVIARRIRECQVYSKIYHFSTPAATLYNAGTHQPLAIRWSAKVKGGRSSEAFISFQDFAPTLLEAAGLKATPAMTGRSFLDTMYRVSLVSAYPEGWQVPAVALAGPLTTASWASAPAPDAGLGAGSRRDPGQATPLRLGTRWEPRAL